MNNLSTLLSHYLAKVSTIIAKNGPAAWHQLVVMTHWVALLHIIGGFVALFLFVVSMILVIYSIHNRSEIWFMIWMLSLMVGLFSAIFTITELLSIYNWLGVFHPQSAIMYELARRLHLIH